MTTVTPAVLSEHDLSAYDGWCQSQADGAPPNSDIANLVTAYRALKQEREHLREELSVAIRQEVISRTDLVIQNMNVKQERDQLRKAAQQAAQGLKQIMEWQEKIGVWNVPWAIASRTLAALAQVGIRPTGTNGGNPA